MRPTIAVVCPTVTGREESLRRCLSEYHATVSGKFHVVLSVPKDEPTWGIGVQRGLDDIKAVRRHTSSKIDYLHLLADDLVPHDGWVEHAIEAVDAGFQPAPWLVIPEERRFRFEYGHPPTADVSDWKPTLTSVIPFMKFEWWHEYVKRMIPLHFFSDDYISYMLRRGGIETMGRKGYAFTHLAHDVRAGAGMGRERRSEHDHRLYCRWLSGGAFPTRDEVVDQ